MGTITISEEKFNKVINDVENLLEDVIKLLDQDGIAKKRLKDIKNDPSIAKSDKELEDYLKYRGVKIG